MAWGRVKVKDQKKCFIQDYLSKQFNITELCRHYDISRPTAYKWIPRYIEHGEEGLKEQSRAPKNQPRKTSQEKEDAILEVKCSFPSWGADKIKPYLERCHPDVKWPSSTCMYNILDRNGLVIPRKRRNKVSPRTVELSQPNASNDVWCVDFKGWFLTQDGKKCEPLTMTDAFSRYLLRCAVLPRNTTEHVWHVFDRAFREYGLPTHMLSDNGPPFGSTGVGRLCQLSINLIKAGVTPEWISPGKPQENGRHERMHKTLKAETASPSAKNLKDQIKRFADFQNYYNFERPHEGINQYTPGMVYKASSRIWSGKLRPPEYSNDYIVRKVMSCGKFNINNAHIYIGRVLEGEPIGIKQEDNGFYEVYYGPILLGYINHNQEFMRPKKERTWPR